MEIATAFPFAFFAMPVQLLGFGIIVDFVEPRGSGGSRKQTADDPVDHRAIFGEFESFVVADNSCIQLFEPFDEFSFRVVLYRVFFFLSPIASAKHNGFVSGGDAADEHRLFFPSLAPTFDSTIVGKNPLKR